MQRQFVIVRRENIIIPSVNERFCTSLIIHPISANYFIYYFYLSSFLQMMKRKMAVQAFKLLLCSVPVWVPEILKKTARTIRIFRGIMVV
ncbi:hypothetical protein XELAEV_18045155mg [Xenopus laevis]|uniref:Uncharacterized protein n=1 Tax=Xenopus laevis TaxID=8355 RepID=A0A974H404_XENLA|nr:hypothetical protein XELAEV_18045155mg [Xenopus laevis]